MGVHYVAARLKATECSCSSYFPWESPTSSFHSTFLYSPFSHFSPILLYLWICGNTAIVHQWNCFVHTLISSPDIIWHRIVQHRPKRYCIFFRRSLIINHAISIECSYPDMWIFEYLNARDPRRLINCYVNEFFAIPISHQMKQFATLNAHCARFPVS